MPRPHTERRVLVVDDDDSGRSAIAEVLLMAGYDFRKRASLTKVAGQPALPAAVNRRRRA
jgi:CheY-like chemotaxis protein